MAQITLTFDIPNDKVAEVTAAITKHAGAGPEGETTKQLAVRYIQGHIRRMVLNERRFAANNALQNADDALTVS